jgi:hypothetical protein
MRFQRHGRYEFTDTPRKRLAFFAKQRRERESLPLFAEEIAQQQAERPGVDEVMQQRAESFAKSEQGWRDRRAGEWRKARKKIAAYDDASRSVIRKFWNEAPYPATPEYLLCMLHDIEKGRISLDRNPPWRPTEEEIRIGRENIARYSERLKAQSQERSR